jgi:hypothetical protein
MPYYPPPSSGTPADGSVTNAKLADEAQSTIKGRASGAGTGAPQDLTATQATAILNNVVGDSGSGGTKGLVPAPAAGDAAAGKFLKADGTFAVPSSSGANTTLSNLTSPVTFNQDLLPLSNGGQTIGSFSKQVGSVHSGGNVNIYAGNSLRINNTTNDETLSINASTLSAGYTLTMPTAQGSSGTVLTNNGSGTLSWAASGSGANTTLSNLDSPTAVNRSLTFDTGSSTSIRTKDDASADTRPLSVFTGTPGSGFNSGYSFLGTASATGSGSSGQVYLQSGDSAGSTSGPLLISSGAASSNSGNITIQTGTSGATRGYIKFDSLVAVLPTGTSDPSTSYPDGSSYYNTSTDQIRVLNGGTWRGIVLV